MLKPPFFRARKPQRTYIVQPSGSGDSLVIADGATITVLQMRDIAGAALQDGEIHINAPGGAPLLTLPHARNAATTFEDLRRSLTSPRGGVAGRWVVPRFVKVLLLLVGLYLLVGVCLSAASSAPSVAAAGGASVDPATAYTFEPKLAPVPVEAPKLACGGKHTPDAGAPDVAPQASQTINLK